jgi:hypothetical protein
MTGTGWVYYTIWFYVVLFIVGSVTSIFSEFWVLVRGRVYLASGVFDGFATYGYHRTQQDGSH